MAEVRAVKLTPTQRKMLDLLSDGMPHTRESLHACLWDECGPLSNIQMHISALRKIVRQDGEDIVCVIFDQEPHYRHMRMIDTAAAKARVEASRQLARESNAVPSKTFLRG
jgi:LmbE family N-acetylglucosaminyl deacetylase